MATGMMGERLWSDLAASANVALFTFAKVVTGNKLDLCGAGGVAIGVFTDVAGNSNPCTVQMDGVGKVTIGAAGALAPGVKVESDSSGKAVALASGYCCGILLTGGAAGDVVSIKLF